MVVPVLWSAQGADCVPCVNGTLDQRTVVASCLGGGPTLSARGRPTWASPRKKPGTWRRTNDSLQVAPSVRARDSVGIQPSPARRCVGANPEAGPQTPLGTFLVPGQKATVTPATEPELQESWGAALANQVCGGLPRAPGPTGSPRPVPVSWLLPSRLELLSQLQACRAGAAGK